MSEGVERMREKKGKSGEADSEGKSGYRCRRKGKKENRWEE